METFEHIVTVLGAFGGMAGLVVLFPYFQKWCTRVYLHRFTSKSPERLWLSFRDIHEQRFPDEEIADSYDDIRKWIEQWDDAKTHPLHDMEEILLARCVKSRVRSYVYAQYYHSSKFAFLSYIATDKNDNDAKNVDMPVLLTALFKTVRQYDASWKAIIGELEEVRIENGRRKRHAEQLFELYRRASEKLRRESGVVFPIFCFMFEYHQPVLRPEDTEKFNVDNMIDLSPELKQWLLYVPNGAEAVIKKEGRIYVEKERAVEVLEFIFRRLYRDAFLDARYQQYLSSALTYHVKQLGSEVRLARSVGEVRGFD